MDALLGDEFMAKLAQKMTTIQRKKFKHLIGPINLADYKTEQTEHKKAFEKADIKLHNNAMKEWITVQNTAREAKQAVGEVEH
jgi:hypothetical protein